MQDLTATSSNKSQDKIIALGCDHAGYPYKEAIIDHLISMGLDVMDVGTHSIDAVDYPDFVHPVADAIEAGEAAQGVLICGSGNGVAMTANKHQHIRAAICWTTELAALARQHNDANVVAIPARFITPEEAVAIVDTFVQSTFEGGRHQRRVNKIACC